MILYYCYSFCRKCNGEVKVFDESMSDYGLGMSKYNTISEFKYILVIVVAVSGTGSPQGGIEGLRDRLVDLSVTSTASSERSSLLTDVECDGDGASYRPHCCRSCTTVYKTYSSLT